MPYRDTVSTVRDLHEHERLALGGLLRVLVRADGRFSAGERAAIEELAADLGDELFDALDAAASLDDVAVRDLAARVVRGEARDLIRGALEHVALAEMVTPGERAVLDWCDDTWR